jgi:hypothetical protein
LVLAMLPSVTVKQVVIVTFDQDLSNSKILNDLQHPAPRVICYQVTLDPARLSPNGDFIRFGQWSDNAGQGDEITGWVHLDDLTVEEILAEWDGEAFRPFVVQSAERAA